MLRRGDSIERKIFQAAVGLAWLALPLTALKYWTAWDRLPMRMAVHFDVNWQPNGWTSRKGARMLALAGTAFLLAMFTIAGYASRRTSSIVASWAIVAVFYGVLGFVYYVNGWVVDRNLGGQQPTPFAELIVFHDRDAAERFASLILLKLHS
jgi:uncharacterized membrane protein